MSINLADLILSENYLTEAQREGETEITYLRIETDFGLTISQKDLQKVLAYYNIRDLTKEDINYENYQEIFEAITAIYDPFR